MGKKDAGKKRAEKTRKRKKRQATQLKPVSTGRVLREQAAELFEDAMRSENPIKRRSLLNRVVELDPGEIDAWVQLADDEPDIDEAKAMLQTAIRHGRKQLKDDLKTSRGMFWGLYHTRPFMRAKHALACLYRDEGNLEEAAPILEEMLDLNEMDNQGVRWELIEVYLRQDQIDDAEKLIARFPDDCTPFLAFTGLLVQFRKSGDSDDLRQKLKEQAECNPHIVPRLLDHQLIDYYPHPMFGIGSEEEADLYCQQLLSAWRSAPGAITWLRSASVNLGLEIDVPSSILSGPDIKKEIQRLRTKVKKLPQCRETWFAEGAAVAGEDAYDEGWILTVLEEETDEAVFLEPGEGETVSPDSMLLGLLEAMLRPEYGEPRRPARVVVFDHSIFKKLFKRLERLDIELDITTTRPDSMEFTNRGVAAFIGDTEVDFQALKSLPVLAHSWVIDWKQLPILVPGADGSPANPWMILMLDEDSGSILAQHLVMNEPQPDDFSVVIQQATHFERFPEPALPESLIVRSADNRPAVDAIAEKLDVLVRVADCSVADEAFSSLVDHLGDGDRPVLSLVEVCDGDLGLVEEFYEAAADFFKSKIWLNTRPEAVVKVSCPSVLPGDWFAVVMGQMGQELGIIFFNSLEAIRALYEDSDVDNPGAGAEHLQGMSFSLNEQFAISPDEVAAAEQFGWPVAAPEAWPSANVVNAKKLQSVSAEQLRFLSIAIKATSARLLNAITDGSARDKSAGEIVTVNVELLDV